jgi:autoinducer 2-degrading protein
MTLTCVHIFVKPGSVSDFIESTAINHRESVKEKGNLRFDLLQQADDPCRFLLYEAYENDAAAAEHKNTPHYLKWRDSVQGMMAEPRKGIKYNVLEPADKSKW